MAALISAAKASGQEGLAPPPLAACDEHVIQQALFTPQAGVAAQEFYPSLPEKAAVLLYSLAKSQACPDGNKRIAVVLVEAFLALNGAMLCVVPEDDLAETVLRVATSPRERRDEVLQELRTWMDARIADLDEAED